MSLLFYFIINVLYSVSAPPNLFNVEQMNGDVIPVRMYGHEYYNWIETEDGYVIDFVEDDLNSGWYYSELDDKGKFIASDNLVQYPAPNDINIIKHLKETFPNIRDMQHHEHNHKNTNKEFLNRNSSSTYLKPLVFLVDFHTLGLGLQSYSHSKEQFQSLFFDTDLNPVNANLPTNYNMSVKDYYHEISNGKLSILGDSESIVDWTTVQNSYSYYVNGNQGTGWSNSAYDATRSAAAILVEIAMKIEEEGFDFSEFDGNNDGDVDVIFLIMEGWMNGDDDQFWPHQYQINRNTANLIDSDAELDDSGFFIMDGVKIKKYIVIPEESFGAPIGISKGDIQPIGTTCHELGHILDLPDLYDTSVQSKTGIGSWGLMGSGNYAREYSPAYLSAWSRYKLGFIDPVIADNTSELDFTLNPAEGTNNSNHAIIIPLDSYMPHEYLILENRQQIYSDQFIKGSGLLVWHIDENITEMYPLLNDVNANPDHYGVKLIQADGLDELSACDNDCADSTDPFTIGALTDIYTYSYDRDANGIINNGSNSEVYISNINIDSDNNASLSITNPNKPSRIVSYDEGGYLGYAYEENNSFNWIGIRFTAIETGSLAGLQTVFPPTAWESNVTDYSINIWKGWSANKPTDLLYSNNEEVQWDSEVGRGYWAFINLAEFQIPIDIGNTYYIEIDFNGTGGVYPVDLSFYSNSSANNLSYYRNNTNHTCIRFTEGDWNIRAVISEQTEYLSLDEIEIPQSLSIGSNYPNPFNPSTTFPIILSEPASIGYKVFNIWGQELQSYNEKMFEMGPHDIHINMGEYSSGIYFCQFNISGISQIPKKIILLK